MLAGTLLIKIIINNYNCDLFTWDTKNLYKWVQFDKYKMLLITIIVLFLCFIFIPFSQLLRIFIPISNHNHHHIVLSLSTLFFIVPPFFITHIFPLNPGLPRGKEGRSGQNNYHLPNGIYLKSTILLTNSSSSILNM